MIHCRQLGKRSKTFPMLPSDCGMWISDFGMMVLYSEIHIPKSEIHIPKLSHIVAYCRIFLQQVCHILL
jgi:hypothetical protein